MLWHLAPWANSGVGGGSNGDDEQVYHPDRIYSLVGVKMWICYYLSSDWWIQDKEINPSTLQSICRCLLSIKRGGGLRDWSFKAPLKTSLINTAGPWPIQGLEAPTLHTVENPRYNFTVGSPSSWFCIWRPDRPQIVSYCNRYLGKK